MVKVQNTTRQVVPIIIPDKNGGEQINIKPREIVGLGIDKPTAQILSLQSRGILKIK
jgi:hypothetical protein